MPFISFGGKWSLLFTCVIYVAMKWKAAVYLDFVFGNIVFKTCQEISIFFYLASEMQLIKHPTPELAHHNSVMHWL